MTAIRLCMLVLLGLGCPTSAIWWTDSATDPPEAEVGMPGLVYTYTYNDSVDFTTARQRCEDQGQALAMPRSKQQWESLKTQARAQVDRELCPGSASACHQHYMSNSAWLGLEDSRQEGMWHWSDGSPVGWNMWAPGQPDDTPNFSGGDQSEDCGVWVIRDVDATWHDRWNDVSCHVASRGYVCQRPGNCEAARRCLHMVDVDSSCRDVAAAIACASNELPGCVQSDSAEGTKVKAELQTLKQHYSKLCDNRDAACNDRLPKQCRRFLYRRFQIMSQNAFDHYCSHRWMRANCRLSCGVCEGDGDGSAGVDVNQGLNMDTLRVKFPTPGGRGKSDGFTAFPMTRLQAERQGFIKISEECGDKSKWRGQRYMRRDDLDGDDRSVILLYDMDGRLAGLQSSIPRTSSSTDLPLPFVQDGDYWTVTAYFTNPNNICTRRGTTKTEEGAHKSKGLYIQMDDFSHDKPGGQSANSLVVPGAQGQLPDTWTQGKCFNNMGVHFWHNLTAAMDCRTSLPVSVMFHKQQLVAFSWIFFTDQALPGRNYERPDKRMFGHFAHIVPPCVWRSPHITTMHVYLGGDPSRIECP